MADITKTTMKKLYNKIANIEKDKLLHIMAGGFIAQLTGGILSLTGMDLASSAAFGIVAGFAAGFLKECYDQFKKNSTDFDPIDLAMTTFGSVLGGALLALPTLDVKNTFWFFN